MLAVLQFDSASVSLLERMLAEGRLPTLSDLIERGRRYEMEGPGTHFAAGAFHTLYSGLDIPDHGVFYPFQWSATDQRARYMSALDPPAPIWERLAELGQTTLAIDPYESRPPTTDVPGTLVCGWQLVDRVVLRAWSRPPRLRRDLGRLFGKPSHAEEIFGRPYLRELLALRRTLVAGPGRVADAGLHLLEERPYDLAWLTFTAAHIAGHQFWDQSQLDPDALDDRTRRVLESALGDVYEAVDQAMGRVVAALPEGTDVIVCSAVGMDVNTSRADLLPEMLAAVLRGGPQSDGDRAPGAIWRLRAAIPASARGRVARALPDAATLDLTARLELRGMDWSTTRAFAHPADNQGYVRANVRGRERDGIVAESDLDDLYDEIAEGLSTFADADGAPAVAGVDRTHEVFGEGARASSLPDFVVRWADRPATQLPYVESPRFGRVNRFGAASGRAGNHTEGDAWAIVVPGASSHRAPDRPARVVDVAATAALLGGLDPAGMSGEPLLASD